MAEFVGNDAAEHGGHIRRVLVPAGLVGQIVVMHRGKMDRRIRGAGNRVQLRILDRASHDREKQNAAGAFPARVTSSWTISPSHMNTRAFKDTAGFILSVGKNLVGDLPEIENEHGHRGSTPLFRRKRTRKNN